MNYFYCILFLLIGQTGCAQKKITLIDSLTVDSLGACQGIIKYESNQVLLYGDRETGVIRKYRIGQQQLQYTGEEYRLTLQGRDLINHPTGLVLDGNGNAFIGNSSRLNKEGSLWKAGIFYIDWNRLQKERTLDNALIREIADDICIQGTRPELVQFNKQSFIATADYGPVNNEVRLYELHAMQRVSHTAAGGVMKFKFSCTPWVQNLKWVPGKKILILVQNQIEGRYWRFTFVDLPASVRKGEAVVLKTIDIDHPDELEGFDLITENMGIAVTSSAKQNVFFLKIDW